MKKILLSLAFMLAFNGYSAGGSDEGQESPPSPRHSVQMFGEASSEDLELLNALFHQMTAEEPGSSQGGLFAPVHKIKDLIDNPQAVEQIMNDFIMVVLTNEPQASKVLSLNEKSHTVTFCMKNEGYEGSPLQRYITLKMQYKFKGTAEDVDAQIGEMQEVSHAIKTIRFHNDQGSKLWPVASEEERKSPLSIVKTWDQIIKNSEFLKEFTGFDVGQHFFTHCTPFFKTLDQKIGEICCVVGEVRSKSPDAK